MTISNALQDINDSALRVIVNRQHQIWYCPTCGHVHIGQYGNTHAYCDVTNTIFQLNWRY